MAAHRASRPGSPPADLGEGVAFSLAETSKKVSKGRLAVTKDEEAGIPREEQEAVLGLARDGKSGSPEGAGGMDLKSLGPGPIGSRARILPKAASRTFPFDSDSLVPEAEVPAPLVQAAELARSDLCDKALEAMEHDSTRDCEDEECGLVWLELAACFLRQGNSEKAAKMASEALKIPACANQAEAFLQRLGVPPDQVRSGQ